MKIYSPTGKSYVHIVEIPRNEIDEISVEQCAQPRETLKSFYNRQTKKPDVLINGGLFGMNNGISCFGLIVDGKIVANDGKRIYGIGVIGSSDVSFGKIDEKKWKSWISGYPVLIENGKKTTITDALELDYKARRSIWGISSKNIYLVTVDFPGMNFKDMQDLMFDIGCSEAINLDGGGSTRCLVDGDTITNGLENRAVDNIICVYLKSASTSNPTITQESPVNIYNKGGQIMKIIEDIIPQKGGKVRPGEVHSKKWIVIHETGNSSKGADAHNHSVYLKNLAAANTTYVSWHYTVDDHEIYHHIPDNEIAWHAGDGRNSDGGNVSGIAMEICVNSDGDFNKAMDNAAWLTAKLLKENNLPLSAVKQHHDFAPNGKNCPQTIRDKGLWNTFLNKVNNYLKGTNTQSSSGSNNQQTVTDFKVNDIVQFVGNTHYKSADATQGYTCKPGKVKVTKVYRVGKSKHPYMVVAVSGGGSTAHGWVDEKDLKEIEKEGFKAYTARVTANVLNVRSGPGTGYKVVTTVKKNEVYTIVEEKNGWGLLKSRAGWISLKYVKLVKYV